ncbi:MAG: aquaporin, partial [Candidatus Saccharimonadales bacterium]
MFGNNLVGSRKVAALGAEFLGTGVLTYVLLTVQHSSIGVSYFIALAMALTLAVLTFVFVGHSGAHMNPVVTLGLALTRQVKLAVVPVYWVVQLFGAWCAYELFHYLFQHPVQALYQNGAAWEPHTFFAELVGAFVFTFAWAAALYSRNKGWVFSATVGLAFAVGIFIAAVAGFGLINPALALGTRAWHIWSAAGWGTYVAGPVAGAVVGFVLYDIVFAGKKYFVASGSSSSSVASKA